MTETFRVGSFNVKRLAARERERIARVGAFVGGLDADAVALQEIALDSVPGVARGGGFAHSTFVGHAPSRRRGVAVVHRTPALVTGGERLPARIGDDKGYTRAVLRARGRDVELVGLHLDFVSRRARMRQIDALALALGPPRIPRIVVGDLNAMTLGGWMRGDLFDDTVEALSRGLGVRATMTPQATFPSHAPRWALDWILVSPELELDAFDVVPTPLSDHAAIVATLRDAT